MAVRRFERGSSCVYLYACSVHEDKAKKAAEAGNANPGETKDWFRPAPEVRR